MKRYIAHMLQSSLCILKLPISDINGCGYRIVALYFVYNCSVSVYISQLQQLSRGDLVNELKMRCQALHDELDQHKQQKQEVVNGHSSTEKVGHQNCGIVLPNSEIFCLIPANC